MKAKRRESTIDNTGNDSVFTGGDGVLSHAPAVAFFFSGRAVGIYKAGKTDSEKPD